MKTPTRAIRRLMAAAAELRARGVSWQGVAAALKAPEKRCHRWTEDFESLWLTLLRKAERGQERECRAEARVALRILMRDGEEKSKLVAAQQLLKSTTRRAGPRKSTTTDADDEDLKAYISMVRNLTDDQLREQIRESNDFVDIAVRGSSSNGATRFE